MSEFSFERRFPLISFLDPYAVVSLSYVHFGEYMCAAQIRNELCNKWEWVLVSYRVAVKPPVVLNRL
jgi:hypothetical protein